MANKKAHSGQTDNLRQRAERQLQANAPETDFSRMDVETQRLLHELQVHQIELEMQNEELHRTKNNLETSLESYFELYELSPVGYLTLNEQGLILEANLTAAALLGVPRNTLLKQQLTRFFLPEEHNIFSLQLKRMADTAKSQFLDMRIVNSAGSIFWAHLQAIPLQNGTRRIILEDINDRKIAEIALAKTQATLGEIIDSTEDLIWSVDPVSFRLLTFNASLRDYFLQARNLRIEIGMSAEDLLPEESAQTWHNFYRRALEQGSFTIEYVTHTNIKTLLLNFNPLRVNGEVFGVTVFGKDITERKQTEDALKHSENQYRATLHTLLDGFWIVDRHGRFIDVNDAYCKIIGYSRSELLGRSIQDVEALENITDIDNRIQKVIATGRHRFESQHRCKDGHIIDLDICVNNLPGNDRFCAALRDITEHKRNEAALRRTHDELEMRVEERTSELVQASKQIRESEERHQLATSVAKEAIWEVDFGSGTTWWNRAYAELFNRPPDEHHHGEWWLNQIHPDDRERVNNKFSWATNNGSDEWADTYRMARSDGSYAHIQDRAIFVRNNTGTALRVVGAKLDITERVVTFEKMVASEERYRRLFTSLIEGFCIIEVLFDKDDNAVDYRFLEINPSFERLTGLRNAQGKLMRELVPEHEKNWFEIYGKVAMTGESVRFVNEAKSLQRWYDVSAYRVDGRNSRNVAILFSDITESRRVEEALRESEERLRFALESSHTGAWEMNLLDKTSFHSLEHARIFGYPETLPDWTYDKFIEHVLPEERDSVNSIVKGAIESRNDWNFECRIRRTDGQVRWIFSAGRYLYNTEGAALRASGIVQDITSRKLIEDEILQLNTELEKRVADRTAALAQANEQLRLEILERLETEKALRVANDEWLNTFNASSDPIFLLDTDHHILRANKATAVLFGLPVEEIVGRLCHEIIHGSDAPAILCPQCMLLEDSQSHTSEIFVEKLNRYLLVTVSPIFDASHTLVGSIHYTKDITSIKEAEQVLAGAKSDLERMVSERTAELALAHEQMKKVSFELIWAEEKERERIAAELHDQVGQSLLLAKMKLDTLEDKLSDDSLHSYAADAVSLIGTSIQDIRSLTFRMRPPILDTAGIATSLEWLCSTISNDYNIQVDFSDDGHPKPLSTEMRYSLYQAVRELLLNVVKHAGTETAQLSITTENQLLVVQVADNGVGFKHPDVIMKHVNNGGYGLYNVRQRIEQMGGKFVVESTPGQGTCVTLKVPFY